MENRVVKNKHTFWRKIGYLNISRFKILLIFPYYFVAENPLYLAMYSKV